MLKKPAAIAVIGGVAGILVALTIFAVLFGLGSPADPAEGSDPTPEPTPVQVEGRLGPHLTLEDRIFNLVSPPTNPVYLKLRTVLEFETSDPRWAHVLHGCVSRRAAPEQLVSAVVAGAVPPGSAEPGAPSKGGGSESACEQEREALLAEFVSSVGTGRQLIEDAVTSIVTAKTPEEISTPDGKEALKAEIREAVEERLGDEFQVVRVLFVNFITQ